MDDSLTPGRRAVGAAYLLIQAGRAEEALRTLSDGAAPDDARAWHARALAHLMLGREGDAARAAERGLTLSPDDGDLLHALACARMQDGDLAGAEQAILSALRADADNAYLLARYARIAARAGQIEKSERLVQRALAVDPENTSAMEIRALLAMATGGDREAAFRARDLLRHDPQSAFAHGVLGAATARSGRFDEAADHYVRAVRIDPTDPDVAEAARELTLARHWFLRPLRPVQRFGSGAVWVFAVAAMLALRAANQETLAGVFVILWLVYCVYSWTAFPLLRWWYRRR